MNINRISIGGGLALVAVALLANAAASLVGTPDRVAHADGMKRADKRQQEPVADVVVPRQDEGQAETMAMGGAVCVEVASQQWFGGIRELPQCGGISAYDEFGEQFADLSPPVALTWCRKSVDINDDGAAELVAGPIMRLVDNGSAQPVRGMLYVEMTANSEGQIEYQRSCVLDTADLTAYSMAIVSTYQLWTAHCRFAGWRDMDSDGDQDLLVLVWFWNYGGYVAPQHTRLLWLENTGFEKQQFAEGDINQDGYVDGVDISILLSDWSY